MTTNGVDTAIQILHSLDEHGAKTDCPTADLEVWVNEYRDQVERCLEEGSTPHVVIKRIDSRFDRETTIYDIPEDVVREAQESIDRWVAEISRDWEL